MKETRAVLLMIFLFLYNYGTGQDTSSSSMVEHLKTARSLSILASENNYKDDSIFTAAEELYLFVLSHYPDNDKVNHNLGALYFNRAAYLRNYLYEHEKELLNQKEEYNRIYEEWEFYTLKSFPYLKNVKKIKFK